MHRRSFLTVLGGAAATAARAQQQTARIRRVGVLVAGIETDTLIQRRVAVFRNLLEQLGWTEGRNLQFKYGFVDIADPEQVRRNAAEMIAFGPDLIVAPTTTSVRELQRATRTVPIVFPGAIDPVGGGIVASFARPGGNTTGFAFSEFSTAGKYLELLKEIAPSLTQAAVLRDPTAAPQVAAFGVIQASATSLRMEVSPIDNRDDAAIERGIAAFAATPNSGMVGTPSATMTRHRNVIVNLAARYKLPGVFHERAFADDGGLLSYAPDQTTMWRGAASYVDRILKGEKPGDLPVQLPTKYETVLNMKTAKALGLEVPTSILLRADEVIE